MVYLPVGWSTYFWSSRLIMAHMPEVVTFTYVEKVSRHIANPTRKPAGNLAMLVICKPRHELHITGHMQCHKSAIPDSCHEPGAAQGLVHSSCRCIEQFCHRLKRFACCNITCSGIIVCRIRSCHTAAHILASLTL